MANNTSVRVSLNVDANVDSARRSLNSLQESLRRIQTERIEIIDDAALKNASKAALELQKHLQASVNVDTGKIDLTRFSQSLKQSGQNLNYFYNSFKEMGSTGEQAFLNLSKSIALSDAGMIRLGGRLDDFLKVLAKTAKWQISSNVFTGFEKVLSSAYRYAQDLNESLNEIRIVSGKTTDQMAKFAKEANRAAKALSSSTTDYTDAALIYYQQGLQEEEIAERTEVTIKMANAAGESAQTVSDQMTAVWNNFYDGSKSLEYYADVMTALGAATASSTDEISDGLEKFAATAGTVGLSYEYATSALATVTAETRQSADVVGTAFRTLFTRIQGLQLGETAEDGTTLNKYSKALEAVGVDIKTTSGELKSMDSILAELGDRWGKLSKDTQVALAQTVGGARQYTTLISLMDNWGKFQENLEVANTAEGTLQEQADIYAESWEAASDRVGAAAEEIYSKLLNDEFFIDLLNGFEKFLGGISDVIDGLGGMKGMLLAISAIIMRRYAKEIPGVLNNIGANLGLITGKAREESQNLQKQNASLLSSMVKKDANRISITEERAKTLETINSINMELAAKWDQLTEEERNFYQQKIELVQSIGEEVQETAREIGSLQISTDAQKAAIIEAVGENVAGKSTKSVFGEFEKGLKTQGIAETLRTNLTSQKEAWKDSFNKGQFDFTSRQGFILNYLNSLKEKKFEFLGEKDLEAYIKNIESATQGNIREKWEEISTKLDKAFATAIQESGKKIKESRDVLGVNPDVQDQLDEFATNTTYIAQRKTSMGIDRDTMSSLANTSIPHITKNAEVYSYYASQVMQVAFSFQSASQALRVWNDENADISEKLMTTATSFGSLLSVITQLRSEGNIKQLANMAMGLKKFNNIGIDSKNVLKEMASTGTMTAGSLKALTITLGPLFAKFILITAAIAALVAVFKLSYEQTHKESLAAKRLAENYEKTKKAVTELRAEHQKLQSTISNYKSHKKELTELTKGTDEWRQKVSELNAESLELLNNNKTLFENSEYYEQNNGVLTVTDEGLQALEDQSQERINQGLRIQYAQAAGSSMQQTLGSKEDFQHLFATSQNPNGLSDEQLNNLLNLYNANPESFINIKQNSAILGAIGFDSDSVIGQQIITILERNIDTLSELNSTIAKNTIAAEVYNEQLGSDILEDYQSFDNVPDEVADIISSYVGQKVNEEALENYKKNSENFGEYQREDYAKIIGADRVENLNGNKARYRINGVWEEIDDATARYAIALEKATISAESYAHSINNILYQDGKYIGITGNTNIDNALLSGGSGKIGNLNSLTEEELKGLTDETIAINIDENDAKDLGWEGRGAYVEAVKQQAQGELDKRTAIRNNQKDEFYTNLDEKIGINTTSSDYDAPGDTLGGSSSTGFYEYLEAIGLDPQKFLEKYSHDENAPEWSDDKSYWEKQADEILKLVQIEERAAQKNEELKTQIEQFDLKEEEIESYAKHLQEIATTSEKVADGLKEDAVAAKEVAISATRLNRGLDTLQENLIDWEKILNQEGLDKSSKEYADTITGLKEATADILNIDSSELTEDFITKHFEDIKLAAEGNIEAIENLQKAYSEGYVDQLKTVVKGTQYFAKDLNGLSSEIANFAEENNIEIGASIDLNATGFVATLNDIIQRVPEAKAIIEDLLESLGYSVTIGEESIETLVYLGSITDKINYSNTKAGRAKPKNSGADKSKKLDEELERYHEIKEVLEDIARENDRLSKAKDRAWGGARIGLIDQEIAKTEEAIEAQKEYIRQIEQNIGADRGAIAAYGAQFDEYGRIINYDELIQSQVAKYNAGVASTVDSQVEAAEKSYENFKKALSNYEETADLLEQEYENLIDKQNEVYDKLLEKIEYTVEIKIEVSDRDKAYLDYLIDKTKDNAYDTAEAITLVGNKTNKILEDVVTFRTGISEIFGSHGKNDDFVNKWLNGEISNEHLLDIGFTEQEIKNLQNYTDKLLEANTELMDIKNIISEQVMGAFTEFSEQIQKNIDDISHLNAVLNSYKNIIDLVGKQNLGINGDFILEMEQASVSNATSSLSANKAKYDAQVKMYQDMSNAADKAKAKYEDMLANRNKYSEAELQEAEAMVKVFDKSLEEMEQEVKDSEQEMLSSWETALQAAADAYQQAVTLALEEFEDKVSAGFGSLDSLMQVYNQSREISEQYLAEYQQIYELSKLTRNINNSIDDTDNIKGKERLRDLLLEIEEIQANGVEMSEYDLNYLQKRYELRLAEIALEDAQNAKSQVRMVRDAEGNWNYTYTADDSAVNEARQNYEDKLYALQELSSEYIEEMSAQWIQLQKDQAEALAAIYQDTTLIEEERSLKIQQTTDYYSNRLTFIGDELNKAIQNNHVLYEQDWTNYSKATGYKLGENEKFKDSFNETVLGTIYDGVNSLEELHSKFNEALGAPSQGGLLGQCTSAYETWGMNIDGIMDAAGSSIDIFKDQVDVMTQTVIDKSKEVADNTKSIANDTVDEFKIITEAFSGWVNDYMAKISNAISENEKYVQSLNTMLNKLAELTGAQLEFNRISTGSGGGNSNGGNVSNTNSTPSKGSGTSNRVEFQPDCLVHVQVISPTVGASVTINNVQTNIRTVPYGEKYEYIVEAYGYITKTGTGIANTHSIVIPVSLTKSPRWGGSVNNGQTPLPFDTGGYTGEWGSSGRIAMLHQKELVLNPPDTKNMLQTIELVREITRNIDLNAVSASQGLGSLIAQTLHSSNQTLDQQVTIYAEFPNAVNHTEIEEAFNTLVNTASQYANRKL